VERVDVAVVGAGPAGALAARAAAEAGARTVVLDHRRELGQPVQCGEFVPAPHVLGELFDCPALIRAAYEIPPETVLRETHAMTCVSPYGRRYRFPLDGATVSRRAFDKALAARAEGAGAELRFPVGVTRVADDLLELSDGSRLAASTIVGADGPTSTVGRAVGFRPRRTMFRMITATTDGPLDDGIDLYFGAAAPHGYAWRFPRAHDANVGLGVAALPPATSLGTLLERFAAREHLGPVTERTAWWVPIGPPPESLVVGRAVFAGDAANLVMATNGAASPPRSSAAGSPGPPRPATPGRGLRSPSTTGPGGRRSTRRWPAPRGSSGPRTGSPGWSRSWRWGCAISGATVWMR